MPAPKLIVIGLVAATISAALAFALQMALSGPKGSAGSAAAVTCVVAARDVSAGHRLEESDLAQIELPSRPAGEPVIATRALAVGRTVSVPLAKGQALRTTDLVVAGSGASIASQLEPGMRAITVSLRDSGPEVVLYPGARVDMLATLERPSRVGDQRESVTLTLLEGVRVLAVNDEAVGAKSPAEAAGDRRAASRKLTVALAVTPEQAAQVELASARGTIGIALRPDQERVTSSASGVSVTARSILGLPEIPAPAPPPSEPAAAKTAPEKSETAAEKAAPPRPVWRVSVTRGDATMTHEMPEAATTAGTPRQPNPTP